MKRPIVINLFGAPGAGKSRLAAGIFSKMKFMGYKVELVTEFAKDLTYSQSFKALTDQLMVFSTQHHKMFNLINEVDYIVTDSPLLNSLIYGGEHSDNFKALVLEKHNSFSNVNIYINRVSKYESYGRTQTEEESNELANKIIRMLDDNWIVYATLNGEESLIPNIIKYVMMYIEDKE